MTILEQLLANERRAKYLYKVLAALELKIILIQSHDSFEVVPQNKRD